MSSSPRPKPRALRLLEPLAERAGMRIYPFVPAAGPQIPAGSPALRARRTLLERHGWTLRRRYPPDFDDRLIDICERTRAYTITSQERLAAMVASVRHVVRAQVPGALVECGVWKGGSMMAAALTLRELAATDRELYLFDTFDGMTEPTAADVDRSPESRAASEVLDEINAWCRVGSDEVAANLRSTGYPAEFVRLVEGPVEQTLPERAPDRIAVLRLDTDWYESTAHELLHLYPLLSTGGILLIDDYGAWAGAQRAVDEYFGDQPPFLHRVDDTARLIVKP